MRSARTIALFLCLSVAISACRQRAPARSGPAEPTTGYAVAVGAAAPAPVDVTEHMAVQAQELAFDMVPSSYLEHGYLTEGQEESFNTILEAGRCYRILGVGGATLTDLDLSIADENGNVVGRDDGEDNSPVLGAGAEMLCPRWTGPFYITAHAFRGYGDYGLQVFRTP